MGKCSCGNDRFFAHQVAHLSVIVCSDNKFCEIVDTICAENPEGPWECSKCRKTYDDLPKEVFSDEEREECKRLLREIQ